MTFIILLFVVLCAVVGTVRSMDLKSVRSKWVNKLSSAAVIASVQLSLGSQIAFADAIPSIGAKYDE